MYRLTQFQPCLYALILLGMLGYGLASTEPMTWVVGVSGVGLNAWLWSTGRFRPMPRYLSSILTVAAMIYVAHEVVSAGSGAVLVIGQFLVVLQLVKLWERRGNRDLGQLLVLSLLLMVASAINTSSLLFAILFCVYLLLSLYCCLLFHLKKEFDDAHAAQPPARAAHGDSRAAHGDSRAAHGDSRAAHGDSRAARTDASEAAQNSGLPESSDYSVSQRQEKSLTRSMRRITFIMTVVSVAVAIVVFIAFPRTNGPPLLVPPQLLQSQEALTGFSDEVRFDQVARITQSNDVVAYVDVWDSDDGDKSETHVTDGRMLMLRGVTLSMYTPNGSKGAWSRTPSRGEIAECGPGDPFTTRRMASPRRQQRQHFTLHPTGTRALFALAGAFRFEPTRDMRVRYGIRDESLETEEPVNSQLDYEVFSNGDLGDSPLHLTEPRPPIAPSIAEYALRPDVSGVDAAGPLGPRRRAQGPGPSPLDETIAQNIENHLRGPGFTYTLDITDARTRRQLDPYVWFLSPDGHRGHCEYYAGAMALMCQSLGMEARLVVGFKCNDFNNAPGAGYYIVRQSQAHAWVEVRTTHGWMTFDPTSGRDELDAARAPGRLASLMLGVRHFFDLLEHTYDEKIVAYDNDNQHNLINRLNERMGRISFQGLGNWDAAHWGGWWDHLVDGSAIEALVYKMGGPILAIAIVLIASAIIVLTVRRLWRRAVLRRRAARIGIESLPQADQIRLAEQLAFYDELIRLLERRRLTRAPAQTPMEFSLSLLDLPTDAYRAVRRLTALYYRVRYGMAELSAGQRRRLERVIARLDADIAPGAGGM